MKFVGDDTVEDKINFIIDEYIANVNDIRILLEGGNEQKNLKLKTKWDFFEYISKTHIMEFYVNGINYKLHGRGCFCGPCVRYGQRQTGNAGDAKGDFFRSGEIKRAPS